MLPPLTAILEGRLFLCLINTPVSRITMEEKLLKRQTLKFGAKYGIGGRNQQKQMNDSYLKKAKSAAWFN